MFRKRDFDDINIEQYGRGRYRGLYTTFYGQYAFEHWESEECIRISRAPNKYHQDNGAKFWLSAVLQDDWSNRRKYLQPYVDGSMFRKISESEFHSILIKNIINLITKPTLPLNYGRFLGALVMHESGEDLLVDLFAEYENEYVHFVWESAA